MARTPWLPRIWCRRGLYLPSGAAAPWLLSRLLSASMGGITIDDGRLQGPRSNFGRVLGVFRGKIMQKAISQISTRILRYFCLISLVLIIGFNRVLANFGWICWALAWRKRTIDSKESGGLRGCTFGARPSLRSGMAGARSREKGRGICNIFETRPQATSHETTPAWCVQLLQATCPDAQLLWGKTQGKPRKGKDSTLKENHEQFWFPPPDQAPGLTTSTGEGAAEVAASGRLTRRLRRLLERCGDSWGSASHCGWRTFNTLAYPRAISMWPEIVGTTVVR